MLDLPACAGCAGLDISIFVRAPYDDLVRTTSRFWNASGISVSTGASGIDVQVGSLQSLIIGGIEFDTPLGAGTGRCRGGRHKFPAVSEQGCVGAGPVYPEDPVPGLFDGSVRGLSAGAPVEFRGITMGRVTSVALEFDPITTEIRIPVGIEIEPQRLVPGGFTKEELAGNDHRRMAELVKRGLRAQLQSGNLLTGELFVDLTFAPDAPPAELDMAGPVPVIPSVAATIEALQASVTAILNKVAALPVEELVASLTKTAAGLEAIVNTPDIQATAKSLGETIALVQQTISRINAGATPLLGSVTSAAEIGQRHAASGADHARLDPAHRRLRLGPDRQRREHHAGPVPGSAVDPGVRRLP